MGRLLTAVDRALLPNFGNVDPRYLNASFDLENHYSVPYMWGTTLLAYRKDKLGDAPNPSWALLFEDRMKDKISLLDERNECFGMAMLMRGVDVSRAGETAAVDAVADVNRLVKEHGAKLGSDNQMKDHLISGISWAALMYSGDAALIAQEHPEIGYLIPKEGAVVWVDNFAIPRDTRRPRNAHQFIDFMLEAKTAAASSNFLRYASTNRKALPLVDPALLADKTIYPPEETLKRCVYLPDWGPEFERIINRGWADARRFFESGAEGKVRTNPSVPAVPVPAEES